MLNKRKHGTYGRVTPPTTNPNPMKDIEVTLPPDDAVSSMAFSPASIYKNFLIAGSWDNNVRCWDVDYAGKTVPVSMQTCGGPVLDVCWSDDGTKVFMAGCDKQAKLWDLGSNQAFQVAAHDAPIKTCNWIKGPNYSCLMTGSWDKTLKFWDTRSPQPMKTFELPERCYCADVDYPMAVVGTAGKTVILYQLEGIPFEYKRSASPLQFENRCVAIFRDKNKKPTGYALGSVEGRVAIQYVNSTNPTDNFTFKCHRAPTAPHAYQDIYVVNDMAIHPEHGTLATVGGDGTFIFWDKDTRTKLKSSEKMEQSISSCAFSHNGQMFGYSVSYDWSKGHEYNDATKKNRIFLRTCCYAEAKPQKCL